MTDSLDINLSSKTGHSKYALSPDGKRMLLLSGIAFSYIIAVNIIARLYGIQEFSELFRASRIGLITLNITLFVISVSHFCDLAFAKKCKRFSIH